MTQQSNAPKGTFAITGGGTGGHVYPAIAILKQLETLGYSGIYVGHPHKLEAALSKQLGIRFVGVALDYFYNFRPQRLLNPFPLIKSVVQCLRILRRERVRFLVAVGGYVSVPAFLAAQLLQIPCIVHEQNVNPGRANRLFLKFKPLFLTTFGTTARCAGTQTRAVHTGCPINESIGRANKASSRAALGLQPAQRVVLVLGGSGGAVAINEATLKLIPFLLNNSDVILFHVTGRAYYDSVRAMFQERCPSDLQERYRLLPYADPVADYYACADIIISRSGAASINEIFAVGRPCILIPSPNVTEDHQEVNARLLENIGLAEVIREADLSTDLLLNKIDAILQHPEHYLLKPDGQNELKDPRRAAAVIAESIEKYLSDVR